MINYNDWHDKGFQRHVLDTLRRADWIEALDLFDQTLRTCAAQQKAEDHQRMLDGFNQFAEDLKAAIKQQKVG